MSPLTQALTTPSPCGNAAAAVAGRRVAGASLLRAAGRLAAHGAGAQPGRASTHSRPRRPGEGGNDARQIRRAQSIAGVVGICGIARSLVPGTRGDHALTRFCLPSRLPPSSPPSPSSTADVPAAWGGGCARAGCLQPPPGTPTPQPGLLLWRPRVTEGRAAHAGTR